MAAFTTFTDEALDRYLVMFGMGRRVNHAVIEGGIENSNYAVTLEREGAHAEYVLTILEGLSFDDAPFFGKVLTHLQRYGLPVAAPRQTLDGMNYTIFCGKPTYLFPRLAGAHLDAPDATHCRAIGAFLGSAHKALGELDLTRENPYDMNWVTATLAGLKGKVADDTHRRLASHADLQRELDAEDLPCGLIHGDLFRDNALFDSAGELTGVIDFYHACTDALILDLAITINDWCVAGGRVNAALEGGDGQGICIKAGADRQGLELLAPMQRAAALRFALTRHQSGEPPLKDPAPMLQLADALAKGAG